ncbi:MAG: S9 family peptidase [Candidatus Eremiobacteraeota bacterium]|nr:S9 family peptidase [Candidatus Eremiobacteraeota bacterium]
MRFLILAAAALAVALPSAAAAASFTPDDEARIVGLSSPVFSPDGARVVLVRTVHDTKADKSHTALVAVDVASGVLRELTAKVEGIAQPSYSADGRELAFLAFDKKHQRQIEVMPAGGGAAHAITKVKFGVQQFAWRPDGRALAYVTQDDPPARIAQHRDFIEIANDDYLTRSNDPPSHVWLVDANGAHARRLTSGAWSAATSYPPSPPASPLSWTPDGKSLTFARVPNTHAGDAYQSEIDVLDVASGSLRPLTDRHRFETFAAVSPDGRRIAYLVSRDDDPNNANALFVTGLAGGRGTDVSARLDRNPWRAIWVDDRTLLVGSNDGPHQSMWLLHDDGTSQRVDTGGAEVNQGYWLQAAVNERGALAFVGTTSLRPSELYYAPSAAAPARRLTHVNDAVASLQLGRSEEIAWNGPDGWKHDGIVTYPPGFTPGKKYPLALVIHGGPTAASTLSFSGLAQSMAARGIIVFQPNYRGSDNGGNAYQRAIYMDAGDGPGRDVMAGLAALEKSGNVDGARVGVSGWSYGGYMTSWLMTHYHPWKTAFSGAAVNDLVDEYDFSDGNVQTAFGFKGSPHVGNNLADYRAQSPITYALDVTCPVLIMSDIGDARVPVTQSFRMYRILKDNNRPVRFVGIPVDGHNPGDIVRRIERERVWTDWAAQGL